MSSDPIVARAVMSDQAVRAREPHWHALDGNAVLRAWQMLEVSEHRRAQLMEPGERKLHLGLDARHSHDPISRRAFPQVAEQRGLADPRLAPHDQHLALTRLHTRQQPIQRLALAGTADQPDAWGVTVGYARVDPIAAGSASQCSLGRPGTWPSHLAPVVCHDSRLCPVFADGPPIQRARLGSRNRKDPPHAAHHRSRPRRLHESASWDGVIDPLVAEGHSVVAAANPVRAKLARTNVRRVT
jgi:hypothetical protein